MPYDQPDPSGAVDRGAEDNDAARLDSLEARVDAIEQKLGIGQQQSSMAPMQQQGPGKFFGQ